jgi:leucyl aminopeptidase
MQKQIFIETKITSQADWTKSQAVLLFLTREELREAGNLAYPEEVKQMLAYVAGLNEDAAVGSKVLSFPLQVQGRMLQMVLAGLGTSATLTGQMMQDAAGEAVRELAKLSKDRLPVLVLAPVLEKSETASLLTAMVEGLILGSYTFNVYKSAAVHKLTLETAIFTRLPEADKLLKEAVITARAVNFTRDLCNEPGNKLTPAILAEKAAQVAKTSGLDLEILTEEEMTRKNMQAILAVGQGSIHGPQNDYLALSWRSG